MPQVFETSQVVSSHINGPLLTLAQLDAFITTVKCCFCDDGVDKVGFLSGIKTPRTFSRFLQTAFIQLIGFIAAFVHQ